MMGSLKITVTDLIGDIDKLKKAMASFESEIIALRDPKAFALEPKAFPHYEEFKHYLEKSQTTLKSLFD